MATAGDVNGDGYADVIFGERWYDFTWDAKDYVDAGRVMVVYGSESGLGRRLGLGSRGDAVYATMGDSVSTAGDVNGDGYADIIVGVSLFDGGSTDEGKAFVWHGSADGPNGGVDTTTDTADWCA